MKSFTIRALLFLALCFTPLAYATQNGGDDEGVNIKIKHTNKINVRNGGDADVNVETGKNKQSLALQQDIDRTENSLVTVAPALSANGVRCDMESDSFSILIVSKGKSRCTSSSQMWRDVNALRIVLPTLGFDESEVNEVVVARMCQDRTMKKSLKATGFNCHAAQKSPEYRGRHYGQASPAVFAVQERAGK